MPPLDTPQAAGGESSIFMIKTLGHVPFEIGSYGCGMHQPQEGKEGGRAGGQEGGRVGGREGGREEKGD